MSNEELERRVIGIVAKVTHVDPVSISRDTNLVTGLAMDSAAALVLLVELEDAFDLTLSDRAAARMRTLGDILDHLRELVISE